MFSVLDNYKKQARVIENYAICPIVFNIYERLRVAVGYSGKDEYEVEPDLDDLGDLG